MRHITYFLVVLVFSFFTIHLTLDINSEFTLNYTFYDIMNYVLISWVPALVAILSMSSTRTITKSYGRFLLLKAKTALKINLYIINILLFVLWTFVLSFIICHTENIDVYQKYGFFMDKILISLLYGVAIDLVLNGFTIIRRHK